MFWATKKKVMNFVIVNIVGNNSFQDDDFRGFLCDFRGLVADFWLVFVVILLTS